MTTQASPLVQLFAPDGSLGDVPYEQMHAALQAGGKMAVQMKAPDGTTGFVPADRVTEASKAGGEIVPFDLNQPVKRTYALGHDFGMDVARGLGFDADRIAQVEDKYGHTAAVAELGAQALHGLKGLLHDPLSPITGSAANFEEAVKSGSPGQIVGALAGILGGAEGTEGEGALARAGEMPAKVSDTIGSLRDRLGRMMRDPQTNQLNTGTKAVSSLLKLVGGPEVAEALVPDHPEALRNMTFEQKAQDLMRRQRQQDILDRAQAREEALGRKATVVAKKPIGPAPEQPQLPAPKVTQPARTGSEGRPATWTNETVRTLASWGDPDAIEQAKARGFTDIVPKYSTVQLEPRSVTRFDQAGNPLP